MLHWYLKTSSRLQQVEGHIDWGQTVMPAFLLYHRSHGRTVAILSEGKQSRLPAIFPSWCSILLLIFHHIWNADSINQHILRVEPWWKHYKQMTSDCCYHLRNHMARCFVFLEFPCSKVLCRIPWYNNNDPHLRLSHSEFLGTVQSQMLYGAGIFTYICPFWYDPVL